MAPTTFTNHWSVVVEMLLASDFGAGGDEERGKRPRWPEA
jgi:hypothetical protein